MVALNQNNFGIENRTSRTHPRTEDRPMRRRLMLGMVPSMFGSLGLSQRADGYNTKDEGDCENLTKHNSQISYAHHDNG